MAPTAQLRADMVPSVRARLVSARANEGGGTEQANRKVDARGLGGDDRASTDLQPFPDAAGGDRTHDLRIKSPLLCQLSYGGQA